MGPNDASDASFGPYVCVFFFLTCFFIINSCIIGSAYQIMMEKGGDEGNYPNDASDASFGPYVCVFFSYVFFYYWLMYYRFHLSINDGKGSDKGNDVSDTSFGPYVHVL